MPIAQIPLNEFESHVDRPEFLHFWNLTSKYFNSIMQNDSMDSVSVSEEKNV